jgi:glucose/arabinose dehydrogenase
MRRAGPLLCVILASSAGCGEREPAPAPARASSRSLADPIAPAPVASEPVAPEAVERPSAPRPPPSVLEPRGPYLADVGRDCDGLPRLALTTLPGRCVGIALHAEVPAIAEARGRFRPRTIVQDPERDDVMWVVDAGARRARAGRLFRMSAREGEWTAEVVLDRLDRPHGLRLGPDGWLYIGEVQRVIRVDPRAADPSATVERIIDELPIALPTRSVRFHPLTSFVFTPSWDVVLNMGSGTDRCLESLPADRCHDEDEHTAALWRYRYLGERRWAREPEHLAHGLRNSVALVAHASGTILQGENGSDFAEADRPHEELNVIEAGRHYGWPYCYDRTERDPAWTHSSFGCDPRRNPTYAPPHLLLPAHGAPLGMMYYEGTRLPELSGKLLIALHGHREGGHRVLVLDVGADGVPAADAQPREVIAGWAPTEAGPRGAPVDMTTARDGSVWLVEDTNGTVLRLSSDAYAASTERERPSEAPAPEADATFAALHRDVLRPRCSACHDHLAGDATSALRGLTREGWLTLEEGEPRMWQRVRDGAERPMPPDGALPRSERAAMRRWLDARAAP